MITPDDIRRLARGADISEEQAACALVGKAHDPQTQFAWSLLARRAITFPQNLAPEQRAAIVREKFADANLDRARPPAELERAVFGYIDDIVPPAGSFKAKAFEILCHPAITVEMVERMRAAHRRMMASIERFASPDPVLGCSPFAAVIGSVEADPETLAYVKGLFANDELKDTP